MDKGRGGGGRWGITPGPEPSRRDRASPPPPPPPPPTPPPPCCCSDSDDDDERGRCGGGGGGICSNDDDLSDSAEGEKEPLSRGRDTGACEDSIPVDWWEGHGEMDGEGIGEGEGLRWRPPVDIATLWGWSLATAACVGPPLQGKRECQHVDTSLRRTEPRVCQAGRFRLTLSGNGVRTPVNAMGKIPSTGKNIRRIEPTTLHETGQPAQQTTNQLFLSQYYMNSFSLATTPRNA